MNAFRLVIIIIAVAIMLPIAAVPERAMAQDQAKATKIELSASPALDNRGHAVKGQFLISATLTTADGRFVVNSPVQFVENVEFFGQRSADLGSSVTDSTGYAAVVYQPSQTGQHTIIARFGGDSQHAASDATYALNATDVVPPFIAPPLPLASVGKWLSVSMAVLGVAFWLVLLGVLGRTVWRIRTAPDAVESLVSAVGASD